MDFLLEATFFLASGKQYWIPPNSTKGSEVQWLEACSITAELIDTKKAELEAEWTTQEYARNRAAAYPSTGDQLDMIYKDMKNSTTSHADAVEAIKTKYPKG